jgi:hypothetical protein
MLESEVDDYRHPSRRAFRFAWYISKAAMPLGTVWVLTSVVISALCGTGVALCREIMLEELQRRLPDEQKIKYPRLSYKYPLIARMHAEFYPESRIRALSRFLFGIAILTMGTLMFGSLVMVIYRRVAAP